MASIGQTPGLIIAAGVGAAASVALQPAFEVPRQDAWARLPHRILDPGTLARLVAQGGVELGNRDGTTDGTAYAEALRNGYSWDKLDALVYLAQTAPPVSEAQNLRRRDRITPAQLVHAFAKAGIEPQYWEGLADLVDERLSPQVMALAIVRGLVPDPGFLPVGPPSAVGKVKPFPVVDIDAVTEAAAAGISRDRLRVLTGIQGRPMGPEGAASAYFRGILERPDYDRAIAEGDVRNEWAAAILEAQRQIPSVADYVNAHIRGWITTEEMHAGVARHGMSAADADLLFLRTGRPATVHQTLIGLRRGGKLGGSTVGIPEPAVRAVQESDIRPEWTNLLWAGAETMPSGFMIRGAVQAGDLTQAEAKQILYESGWRQKWIDVFVASWAGGSSGAASKKETAAELRAEYEGYLLTEQELRTALTALGYAPAEVDREVHLGDAARVKSYRDKALKALHDSYVAAQLTSADAQSYMAQLHIDPQAAAELLSIWDLEKLVTRKTLTAAQIRAAYRRNAITQAEAIADLEEHGYSAADAATYLAS